MQHEKALKPDAKPVCEPLRKRSPKEEDVEYQAVSKLIKMGVLELAVSPRAANNVFVKKKLAFRGTRSTFIGHGRSINAFAKRDARNLLIC